MSGPVRARCLDITRLASRAGRPLTGVDRVELAYARAIAADDVPAFGLCKTRWGYLLLDTAGLAAFAEDRGDVRRVRSLARWRCTRLGLGRLLRRVLPPGSAYLNVGHSN
ncbi:MAG: glycosyltransferase family 1 protein, partial [Pseudomonadota bacterium]